MDVMEWTTRKNGRTEELKNSITQSINAKIPNYDILTQISGHHFSFYLTFTIEGAYYGGKFFGFQQKTIMSIK